MITYGPHGNSFVVRHGGRIVRRARTLAGARSEAVRRAAAFGGVAREEEPPPAPPPKPRVSAEEIVALTIGALRDRLARGDLDEHLDRIEEAEKAGQNRKGALEAIEERRSR